MLYELVTVYDNRLQSLKSQIKLNEAVFGKRHKVLSHWRFSLCIIQIYQIKFQQGSRCGSPSRTLNQRKSDKCDRIFLFRVK